MSWIESPTTGDVPTEKVGSACVSLGDRAIVLHGGKCLGGIQKDVHFGSLRILDVPTMTWIAPVSKKRWIRGSGTWGVQSETAAEVRARGGFDER